MGLWGGIYVVGDDLDYGDLGAKRMCYCIAMHRAPLKSSW